MHELSSSPIQQLRRIPAEYLTAGLRQVAIDPVRANHDTHTCRYGCQILGIDVRDRAVIQRLQGRSPASRVLDELMSCTHQVPHLSPSPTIQKLTRRNPAHRWMVAAPTLSEMCRPFSIPSITMPFLSMVCHEEDAAGVAGRDRGGR